MSPVINKFLVAIATTVAALAIVVPDGVTQVEGLMLVVQFLGALGVYAIPNATRPPAVVTPPS